MPGSFNMLNLRELLAPLEELERCGICPRNCGINRLAGERGYCRAGADFSISSICIHRGEEPVISGNNGICNVFFTNCNLQCIYCQNFQISSNKFNYNEEKIKLESVLDEICAILNTGINIVGFVSPSHFIPQVKVIATCLRALDFSPTFVYNTNGYDTVESLRELEGFIDVYLPDFKYSDESLGSKYSDSPDYPVVALSALLEMFRQTGSKLHIDQNGYALSGMVIRHLVLPGHPDNSINVLRSIAGNLSPDIHISLMSQYYPTHYVANHPVLGRTLAKNEYEMVLEELENLGFANGWVQHLDSNMNYRPDFMKQKPFQE